jgi:hypothetical protein
MILRQNILVSYEIATLPSVARNDNLDHLNFVVGLINQIHLFMQKVGLMNQAPT